MLGKFLKNKAIANAGWLIGGQVIQMVIQFCVGIFTARFLGPSNYGLIGYGTAYTAFFSAVCTLGIHSVLVKELINNREQEGRVLGTAMLLKLISSALSFVTIVAVVHVVDRNDPTARIVVTLCSLGVLVNVLDTFRYWFQSHLKSKITAVAILVGYLMLSAYKIVLLVFQQDVTLFALATSLEYACAGTIMWVMYKRCGGQPLRFSWGYAKQLLNVSKHFILPSLMVSIYGQTDKLMLKQLLSEADVGYYTTAVQLSLMWSFVLQAIIDSLNPGIMEDHKAGRTESYLRKNKMLYAIVFYLSIGVSALYCVLAHPMIGLLYGEEYLPAVLPLQVCTWYVAFSYLGVARNAWVVCENKQRHLIWLYLFSAVGNVILNFVLIPLWGASGAALASLITQMLTIMVVPLCIKDLHPNVKMLAEAMVLKGVFKKKP